jgi:hypothetical protein
MAVARFVFAVCLPFALMPAAAQTPVVGPPCAISSDVREYCLFNDKLYSVGAFIYAAKRVALTCDRGETAGGPVWKLSSSPDCEPNRRPRRNKEAARGTHAIARARALRASERPVRA